jgi:multidrug efflux pump subunit AcrB
MTELMTNFLLAIGAGVLMVFAVLVLLFAARIPAHHDPLGAAAVLGGRVLRSYSRATVLAARRDRHLMLMGIVAKNSILLVDFAIEEMRAGKPRLEALLEAGHKRARPIVMTTIAMVAGMLPVALGWGGDSDFRAPMAIAVIGGLITSTMLTLVIVPAVFTVFDDIERWVAPKASKLLASSDPSTSAA